MGSATSEYSLWLTLQEETEAYQQLRDAIVDLATGYDDAAVFEPHITVVGGVSGERAALSETTRSLAKSTDPLDVTFGSVRSSTTRHQCVFILVEPSIELFDVHQTARETLSLSPEAYVPHVSLVYSDMSLRRRIAVAASIDPSSFPEQANVATLELVDTTGPVSEWESIVAVQL